MYHEVIVMEIKEKYALVMAEDGQILRILYKDGMKVGDCIYILEEDLVEKDVSGEATSAVVIPFVPRKKAGKQHKRIWQKMVAVAAACALFVTSFAVLSKPEKAYAMVSVDGEKTAEFVLNQKNRVKEADSKNDSFTKKEEKTIKGEKVETIKKYFSQDLSEERTIIVGYAFLEEESEEEHAALQRRLEKTFGTEHLLYLEGNKEDIENAKKAGQSLGIYLAEQIVAGENFHKVVNEVTEEEVLELLEKNPVFMDRPEERETIRQKLSDGEEEGKSEETDRDEEADEDALEQQREANPEEAEESEEPEESGKSSVPAEEADSYEQESADDPADDEGEETESFENVSGQGEDS